MAELREQVRTGVLKLDYGIGLLLAAHIANRGNPHDTTVVNLDDTIIDTPKAGESLIWDADLLKWVNGAGAVDFGITVAEKQIFNTFGDTVSVLDRSEALFQFGSLESLGTDEETIWNQGGDEVYVTTNSIDTISSSDVGDTQPVLVDGHTVVGTGVNAQFTFVRQTVTLNGQNKVVLATPLARVQRARDTGSSLFAGDVYVYEDTDIVGGVPLDNTKIHVKILAGDQISRKAAFTVADNEYFILTNVIMSVNKLVSARVDFETKFRAPGGLFTPTIPVTINSDGIGTEQIKLYPYAAIPKNADVKVSATSSAVNTDVSAVVSGFYADII